MSCPSLIQTANANFSVAADGSIPFGNIVRRYGKFVNLNGNDIIACGNGYYQVVLSITLTPTAAGLIGVQLYAGGTPVSGANASETATADGVVNLFVVTTVRVMGNCCDDNCVPISLQLVTPEGVTTGVTVNNLSASVIKL